MRTLQGRVVAITGAGAGIGRSLAEAFAREGTALALSDISAVGLAETVAGLPPCARVTQHVVDVSEAEAVDRWRDAVLAAHGHVHVLVNNAGVTVFGTFAEHTRAETERIVGVNLWGVLNGCRAFLPALRAEGEAHIVNVSSMAGYVGIPHQSVYCATKFAVRGFSQALRAELAGAGVGVTSVHPGAVRTQVMRGPSHDEALSGRMADLMLKYALPPERVARGVVRAVRRNRAEVRMTAESHLTYLGVRLFPSVVRLAMQLLGRSALRLRTTPPA